jgi:ADP-L-glycero-D-manno-heptose 6-epimerase
MNAYGWSKHLFDRHAIRAVLSGSAVPAQWAGLKFFNVYGPNEYHKGAMRSVVLQMFEQAIAGQPITLFRSHRPGVADGGQKRDFVFVEDCVKVILWLIDHPGINGMFNVGTGQARSFSEMAQAVLATTGRSQPIEFVDTPPVIRPNYQYFTEAPIERLRRAGYHAPFATVEQGVAEYITKYLGTSDRYR